MFNFENFYLNYPNFDWNYYIKFQPSYNSEKNELNAIRHFLELNKNNKILYNKNNYYNNIEFDEYYLNNFFKGFDWRYYLNSNDDLKILFNTEHESKNHYLLYGIYENRKKNILEFYNITQLQTSICLKHFEKRFMDFYNLKNDYDITNMNINIVYFGVYSHVDINNIKKIKNKKYIIFGGTDVDLILSNPLLKKQFDEIENKTILFISPNIRDRLNYYGYSSIEFDFDITDRNIFKKQNVFGDSIYIYNGFSEGLTHLYGNGVYEQIIKRNPSFNYIFSNNLKLKNEEMPEIYKKCFICLRLTVSDGNANTSKEMECVGIPIIHNHSKYGLKWNTIDDVENIIRSQYKLNNLTEEKYDSLTSNDKINFYDLSILNNDLLNTINLNINNFSNLIKKYQNILFICSDKPGYGGAATNCKNLSSYYKKMGHNVFSIYYQFENNLINIIENDNEIYVNDKDLFDAIINIQFKPELIILKNFVSIDLKKIFNCKIYYLIPGIFNNNLEKYYYDLKNKNEVDKYFNENVIKQINMSDKAFCNSYHTKEILNLYYGINTSIFYSSFINYYNNKINLENNIETTKYEYGLIISNFNRNIKNINQSIEFLKNKKNVILIGIESSKYLSYGFECHEKIQMEDMEKYYKQIKYIIQDSYFESCSNVKIEALMNNCIVINSNIKIDYNKLKHSINIKKNKKYIIGNYSYMYNIDITNLYKHNSFEGYIVNGNQTKEIIMFIYIDYDITMNIFELFGKICLNNKQIAFNNEIFEDNELINMYHLYGMCNINKNILGLNLFYDDYINRLNASYDKKLFILIYSYYYGKNKLNIEDIGNIIKNTKFHDESVLIISKHITGIGGVQKTSKQLIQTLQTKYNIFIISNKLSNSDYNFEIDISDDDIPNTCILKLNKLCEIEKHINLINDYKYIINNKMNELLNMQLNKKIICICHNSMDSFNKILIENKYNNKIEKLLTINNFHRNLLFNNNYNKNIYTYNNFINELTIKNITIRKKFNYNIAYIGRLSTEKNIQLLINGINKFNENNKIKITLFIIGDGKMHFENINKNIIFKGKLTFDEILKCYDICDYIVSASFTEGKPFSVLEALNYGIPCIHSNINGIDEIIYDGENGFLFELENYNKIKFNMNFENLKEIETQSNEIYFENVIKKAYDINIEQWNIMSSKCITLSDNKNLKQYCIKKNLQLFEINYDNKLKKTIKIFINFKPDDTVAYGGGNISVFYIVQYLLKDYSDYCVSYELNNDIDIFLIIDPFKDNKFKKYSLEDVIKYKKINNMKSKIIIRINDCDKTRIVTNINNSREYNIFMNVNNIDFFVFNSNYIKMYYLEKYGLNNSNIYNNTVIINGCDDSIFRFEQKEIQFNKKIKIVTHHWSSNMNKGYEVYYNLWKYTQNSDMFEFVFIGKNVPNMFKEVPIYGPYVKHELSRELNKCHIYITDSKYDSCPNHVIEAISCGLPILYSNCEGGAKELCMMGNLIIGEMYNDFDELIIKINKIKNNYNYYVENIKKVKHMFNATNCSMQYYNVLLENLNIDKITKINLPYINNILNIYCNSNNSYIYLNNCNFKLTKGNNIFAISKNKYNSVKLINYDENKIIIDEFTNNNNKLDNNKINILLCSDNNYYVGLFAVLHSLYASTNYLEKLKLNCIVPIENENIFSNMLMEFELKINYEFDKSIIYIDSNIIDSNFYESKCYNGGGHLLNLGNLSRLLIGEFMNYEKLIYLDSDSIIQSDIIKKILNFEMKYVMYSACANMENKNNKKRIIIKMESIINCEYDWNELIGCYINKNDYVFMGAPFLTNCSKWSNVYKKIIEIIKIHNTTEGGVYKLFTMSIQNILFYKEIGDIKNVLNVLPDLGSKRKEWDIHDLIYKDVLDWSGIYKPWFINGLYRNLWIHHDIMNLSSKYKKINTQKNITETFNDNLSLTNIKNNNNNHSVCKDYLNIEEHIYEDFEKYLDNMINIEKQKINYNILFVCDVKYLLSKMSRVRFWAIEELSKKIDVKMHFTGPGFFNFENTCSLQQNIINFNINFDIIIWYKPLNDNYNFDFQAHLPFKTCLRYNEMWDEDLTINEINLTRTNIVICHHFNDYLKYKNKLFKNKKNVTFYYNPHHANPTIFKPLNMNKDIDILMSGISKETHYPLKYRLFNLITKHENTTLQKYNIFKYTHPGYNDNLSFLNINQIKYNEIINKSKLCIACSSRYNYRLGKYVEIPMAGSIIVGDLPYEDVRFKNFVIDVNDNNTDEEILNKIIITLENKKIMEEKIKLGLEWSKNFTTSKYVDKFIRTIKTKIFIISDEIRENHAEFGNVKWICDTLKQEFKNIFSNETTNDASKANIIWYLAPWNYNYVPNGFKQNEWLEILKTKTVIFTQHHIDNDKYNEGQLNKQFEFMQKYGSKIHAICNITYNELLKYFDKNVISSKKLWINDKIFYHIENKTKLREKYNFNKNAFLIGSFQKDTEGKTNMPKLSKGPDIFINIVKSMYETNNNIEIILTGLRREYIINELNILGIKYHYYNLVPLETINELFNCLDLYIISSRCEGGPRAVLEAGLTKTPIISTKVGIAPELMARSSLFDSNNWKMYKYAKPNVDLLYKNVMKLTSYEYMEEFKNYLIE